MAAAAGSTCSAVSCPASVETTRRSSPRRTAKISRASSQLGVATAAPWLRRSSTSPSPASWPSACRTSVRLDAEAFADGVLGQLGAGLQRLLDDGASQRLIDGAGAICTATGRLSRHVGAQVCMRALVAVSHLVGNLNRPILSCSIALSRAAR